MGQKKKETKGHVIVVERHIRVFPKTCPLCGKGFTGPIVKKFCSRACVRKATYQKHGEAYRQRRRAKYHAAQQDLSATTLC